MGIKRRSLHFYVKRSSLIEVTEESSPIEAIVFSKNLERVIRHEVIVKSATMKYRQLLKPIIFLYRSLMLSKMKSIIRKNNISSIIKQ